MIGAVLALVFKAMVLYKRLRVRGVTYRVPGGHVLLHTVGHAGRLAAGEAGSGLGNTLLEAVGVDFLY